MSGENKAKILLIYSSIRGSSPLNAHAKVIRDDFIKWWNGWKGFNKIDVNDDTLRKAQQYQRSYLAINKVDYKPQPAQKYRPGPTVKGPPPRVPGEKSSSKKKNKYSKYLPFGIIGSLFVVIGSIFAVKRIKQ